MTGDMAESGKRLLFTGMLKERTVAYHQAVGRQDWSRIARYREVNFRAVLGVGQKLHVPLTRDGPDRNDAEAKKALCTVRLS